VRKKIQKLRPGAAPGPDAIGPRLLKELENELVEGLTMIFRKSVDTGVVPDNWRQANVTPIYKKGAKCDPGNSGQSVSPQSVAKCLNPSSGTDDPAHGE